MAIVEIVLPFEALLERGTYEKERRFGSHPLSHGAQRRRFSDPSIQYRQGIRRIRRHPTIRIHPRAYLKREHPRSTIRKHRTRFHISHKTNSCANITPLAGTHRKRHSRRAQCHRAQHRHTSFPFPRPRGHRKNRIRETDFLSPATRTLRSGLRIHHRQQTRPDRQKHHETLQRNQSIPTTRANGCSIRRNRRPRIRPHRLPRRT